MGKITIITNNSPRLFLDWNELTEKEQKRFEWFNPSEHCGDFIRYRECIYNIHEFSIINNHPDNEFSKWHGYHPHTFDSGVIIKFVDNDSNRVIMGRYHT